MNQTAAVLVTKTYIPDSLDDPTLVRFHHHAVMTELSAATRYYYRVGSPAGGMSEVHSFTTRPKTAPKHAKFVLYGDMGLVNSAETIQRVAHLVKSTPPDFIMHIGDISYADDYVAHMYEWVWNTWFQTMQPITSAIPYMVTPGNHEYQCSDATQCPFATNFTAYNNRFNMPGYTSTSNNSMWYSFDYGPIHWIGLSTETDFPDAPEVPELFGDQLTWLENDLKQAYANRAKVPFILVGGHRPIYASSVGFFDGKTPILDAANLQRAVEHLFLRYKVDVFFVGHVHSYERTYPIAQNQTTGHSYNNPTAPVYIINGCGGNEEGLNPDNQWIQPQPSWSAFRFNQDWGYMVIEANVLSHSATLNMQFFASGDNKLRDAVVITKSV